MRVTAYRGRQERKGEAKSEFVFCVCPQHESGVGRTEILWVRVRGVGIVFVLSSVSGREEGRVGGTEHLWVRVRASQGREEG